MGLLGLGRVSRISPITQAPQLSVRFADWELKSNFDIRGILRRLAIRLFNQTEPRQSVRRFLLQAHLMCTFPIIGNHRAFK